MENYKEIKYTFHWQKEGELWGVCGKAKRIN